MSVTPLTKAEADRFLAPLARFDRVALAVSGGPDSLALLKLSADFVSRHGLAMPVVLTVDHDLRPGSAAEAATVARATESLGARHTILTWQHGPVDAGLQALARTARYDLMAAYCTSHGIPALVTAHHLDDQAETFLMRLKRGSGLDGLAAIANEASWAGLTLLRPLLEVPKTRLIATAGAAGLAAVCDPSNENPRFERVRLRGAMAQLTAIGLKPDAIALSARRLRRARSALDATVDMFLDVHGERSPAGYATISVPAVLSAPEEVGLRALGRLISAVGGSSQPVRLAKLEALFERIRGHRIKAQTLGRCQVVPVGDRLVVFREIRRSGLPRAELRPGERLLWDNRFRVELGDAETETVVVEALGEAGVATGERRDAVLRGVPQLAAMSLPACRLGDGRVLLPDFNVCGSRPLTPWSRHEVGFDFQATFLWGTKPL